MKAKLTRRQTFALAGAGTLAAASGTRIGAAPAGVPMGGAAVPDSYRFPLGEAEVMTLRDGAVVAQEPHRIYGVNVEPEKVQELLQANFLPPDRFENGYTPTLLNTGSELVLFDSGNGAGRRPDAGHMRQRLAEAGVAPEAIDVVVLTHFHPDHIGGLMEGGAPTFPNARYVAPAAEYDFWSPPEKAEAEATARVGKIVQSNVVPLAERTTFIKPGDTAAPGVTAVGTHGHTPGHLSYMIDGGGGRQLLVSGDVANHYVLAVQRPDWHVSFDMDKEAAVAARRQVLGMLAADRIPFVGYHMPFPSVGFIEAAGDGFRYVPVTYQLRV
jgi:glyoxylase-like metal-dependent hydrolase (beta-lactamase superfamily II)